MSKLYNWSAKWKMVYLILIPVSLLRKLLLQIKNITSHETVSYSGVDVQPVESHKHLGFVLDSKIGFMNHIDGKIEVDDNINPCPEKLFYRFINVSYAHILTTAMLYVKRTYDYYCAYYSERARSEPAHTNDLFTNKFDAPIYCCSGHYWLP